MLVSSARLFKLSSLSYSPYRTDSFLTRSYSSYRDRSLPLNTVIKFVPQQQAWVVERFGRFNRILEPGLSVLFPFIDKISYVKTLKEVAVDIPTQAAITHDNVTINMDGVLYYRVVNPFKACYGVEDADYAITQLAQTTMRSEIGKLTLDKTLAERNQLNTQIVEAINEASKEWGIQCLRYEIRDIHPPDSVVKAMHSQVSAERQKRASILESEGLRQAAINKAEGEKQATILASEGDKMESINKASGEAEALLAKSKASAKSIEMISLSIREHGAEAVSMLIAEKYMEAFSKLAKESTTLVLPAGTNDPSSMIAQALTLYNNIAQQKKPENKDNEKKNN